MKRQNELTPDEVHERLGYPDNGITDELFRLGELQVREQAERAAHLEGKAAHILGYSGVLVAFVLASLSGWGEALAGGPRALVFCAALLAAVAAGAAFSSLMIRKWTWFSDQEWFYPEAMRDAETLRRYYVASFHRINQNHGRINVKKGDWVQAAQVAIGLATACLTIAVICLSRPF